MTQRESLFSQILSCIDTSAPHLLVSIFSPLAKRSEDGLLEKFVIGRVPAIWQLR